MIKAIKILIWAYLVLLLTEGALRKWVFPGQADALLIIRAHAFASGRPVREVAEAIISRDIDFST